MRTIRLQREDFDAVAAADPGEGDQRANLRTAASQCRLLGAGIEVFALKPDRTHYPPVMGGKNAIS